jgi:glycosyltransferase involved in cell wall biosynthesis
MQHEELAASVIICTHSSRRWAELQAAVASVQAQEMDGAFEVVVVVDHNAALLHHARTRLPGVRAVPSAHDPGLSGARNTGVEVAKAPIVVFLDDDAVAEPGWLAGHVRAFADPLVVGTGGAIAPAWDAEPPAWWPREFDWVVGCTYEGWAGATAAVIRNPIGANMAFLREQVLEVGGFADELGRVGSDAAGCEETDLAIRIGQRCPQARIVPVPDSRVRHRVPTQRATFSYFTRRCLAEGRSKAAVARRVGTGDATHAERSYVTRTLPAAVLRSIRHGDLLRAGAVVAGFVCTTVGFAQSYVA